MSVEERLAALEYNVRRLMALQRVDWEQPPVPGALPQEALDYLARGDKLSAIKVLTARGMSLGDAKAMVEGKR